jgi:hypothetical protein
MEIIDLSVYRGLDDIYVTSMTYSFIIHLHEPDMHKQDLCIIISDDLIKDINDKLRRENDGTTNDDNE